MNLSLITNNKHLLAIEMFKIIKGISPPIVNEPYDRNETNNYNFRNPSDISLP